MHRDSRGPASNAALVLCLLTLAACSNSPDGALRVTVALDAQLAPTCVVLEVRGTDLSPLEEGRAPFAAGRTEYVFGVARGSLPAEVVLRARAMSGAGCADPLAPGVVSAETPATFAAGVQAVTLELRCGGSVERCDDGADNTCDGLIDCADPTCQGRACDDGSACTSGDTCVAGTCAGAALPCNTPGACEGAAGASCDAGTCSYPATPGAPCGSGLFCRADKSCQSGEAVCNDGMDNDGDGPADCADPDCNLQPCAVSNVCFAQARCESLACARSGPVSCPVLGGGCLAPSGACVEPTGCPYAAQPAGTPCDGGVCSADGGCSAVPPTGPFPYLPSNFMPASYAVSDAGVVINCNNAEIDSDTGAGNRTPTWCTGAAKPTFYDLPQPGGDLALLAVMPSFSIGLGGSLTLSGSRPVVFAVYGDATIEGSLIAAPSGGRGPAGSSGRPGAQAKLHCDGGTGGTGLTGSGTSGGGGGGAFGAAGARGGAAPDFSANSGGDGGVPNGEPTLVPLRGGCAGGDGSTNPSGANGGLGGGAIQVSVAGTLTVVGAGRIGAPGLGGRGGNVTNDTSAGAGGGGSGGGVLLEGRVVVVGAGGVVSANGGAGGEGDGDPGGGQVGNDGESGHVSDDGPARGGNGGTNAGGNGGDGGSRLLGATPGADGTSGSNKPGGGGGGGGVGRIRINVAPDGGCVVGGLLTPAPTGNCP